MKKTIIIAICMLVAGFGIAVLWLSRPAELFTQSVTSGIVPKSSDVPTVDSTQPVTTDTSTTSKLPTVTFSPASLSPTLVTGTINVGPFSKLISVPVTYKNGGYVANTTLDLTTLKLVGLSKYKQANVTVNVTLK